MVIESATDRIIRILVLSIGIGQLAFTLLAVPSILAQYPYLNTAYTAIVIGVFCGLPMLMGAFAFRAPVRYLRFFATVHSISGIVFIVTWPLALLVDRIPDDPLPWLLNMITAGVCFAALTLRPTLAWVYLALTATCSGVTRYITYGMGDAAIAFQDGLLTAIISGVFMSLMLLALRAGREQDEASAMAQEVAAATAVAETVEAQRARFHAFMHDDVLATLHAAARNEEGRAQLTRDSARHALNKMDEFRDGTTGPELLTAADLEGMMRAAVTAHDIPFAASMPTTGDTVVIPSDIGDALTEALAEAIRNSIKHAGWPDGRPVRRTAFATFDATGVEILVNDDGKGFVAHRIGLDRLGIRVSILKRVNSQPGGRATVTSSRGAGTTVSLTWRAPKGTS